MAKATTASLRARWLGEWLREARVAAGYPLTDVGQYLQMDYSTVARFERGTHRIRRSYVKDLIGFYGISDEPTREALLKLNEDSWRRDWWHGDTSDLDVSFIDYTWLEARSSHIWIYEPMLVHGLLQTREYADAIMGNGQGGEAEPSQRQRMVGLRMRRQEILQGDRPTKLSIVLDESAVRRPIGDAATRAGQYAHLQRAAAHSHIDIRILTSSTGWHPGVTGPFALIGMPDPYPDVAYIESIGVRMFLEDSKKVDKYREAFNDLQQLALSPEQSSALIEDLAKELR